MDFLLALFLSAAAAGPTPPKAVVQAQARITILRAHKASAEDWNPASKPNQREILKREKDGSQIRLRLTEFE